MVAPRADILRISQGCRTPEWKIADQWGDAWQMVLDTAAGQPDKEPEQIVRGSVVLTDRSVALLRRVVPEEGAGSSGSGSSGAGAG